MTNANAIDRSWVFQSSNTKEAAVKSQCQRVEEQFQLPSNRLCRYFADSDDPALTWLYGGYFRGFHVPYPARSVLPPYLVHCFFHSFDSSKDVDFKDTIAFDNLIYIRRSSYADAIGLVETYAHELQHVVQSANTPRLLFVNQILAHNLKAIEEAAIATDIPSEREANIVSKRVAEIVCGLEAVRAFAEEQLRLMRELGENEEAARWLFFRDVPSSTQYDLLKETRRLVEKYKDRIDFEMDVDAHRWWVGPLKKAPRNAR